METDQVGIRLRLVVNRTMIVGRRHHFAAKELAVQAQHCCVVWRRGPFELVFSYLSLSDFHVVCFSRNLRQEKSNEMGSEQSGNLRSIRSLEHIIMLCMLDHDVVDECVGQTKDNRPRRPVQIRNPPLRCHPTLDFGRTVGPSLATSGQQGFRLLTKTGFAQHLPIKSLGWIAVDRLARINSVGTFSKILGIDCLAQDNLFLFRSIPGLHHKSWRKHFYILYQGPHARRCGVHRML